MSLYLGKIHYWLYNKIIWAEKAEAEIIRWADAKGMPVTEWAKQSRQAYGEPTGDHALEDVIDQSNIHGWLQARIQSAELRQAELITKILNENPSDKEELIKIFENQGREAAKEYTMQPDTPEGMYNALNDFILEGMPCDRASAIVANDPDKIIWEITTCLHSPYWEEVQGDVNHFYDLREAWIAAFTETLNTHFRYSKSEDGKHLISRV